MPETPNAEQIEYWNEVSGPKWVAMQEDLDLELQPLTDALFRYIEPKPGQSILDIGCGCGATTLALSKIVGDVTGLDVSNPMLDRAKQRAEEAGLTNTTFIEGDAQVYSLEPNSYDTITSRFGIMFFADPLEAFKNFQQSLKVSGSLTFMCWRDQRENPWMYIPLDAAASLVELPPPPEPNAPGPFAYANKEYLSGLLAEAGFTSINIDQHDSTMTMGNSGDLDKSVETITKVGPLSRILKETDSETTAKLKAAVREAVKPYNTDKGVVLDGSVWLVKAQ